MNCSQENEKTSTPDEIILWLNGYPPNYSFKYPLYTISSSTTLNSLKHKITEYLLSSKHLGKNTHELKKIINNKSNFKIKHLYTQKENELEEIDIPYLKPNDILYFTFDNSTFKDSNHYYKYEFIKLIKEGGYGKVFLAKNIITDKKYAIKQIDISEYNNEELYNINRENMILKSMNCKNVVKFFDAFPYDNKFYTVMDFAKGGELTQLLNEKKKLNEYEAREIFKQIYNAVCYIHSKNIIHRDLKPNNILFLDESKTQIVIIDFGISGFSNGNNKENIRAGTTLFMPPEMACGLEFSSNTKLDMWAMGIILYKMVEGIYPFEGKSNRGIIKNILGKKLVFNEKINISYPLRRLIEGLLEKNQKFRIDDDSELFNQWFECDLNNINYENNEKNKNGREKIESEKMNDSNSIGNFFGYKMENINLKLKRIRFKEKGRKISCICFTPTKQNIINFNKMDKLIGPKVEKKKEKLILPLINQRYLQNDCNNDTQSKNNLFKPNYLNEIKTNLFYNNKIEIYNNERKTRKSESTHNLFRNIYKSENKTSLKKKKF